MFPFQILLKAVSSNIQNTVLASTTLNLTNNNFLIFPARLAGVHLPVEEIALTSSTQIHKLGVILEDLDKRLGLQDSSQIKWNVKRESCSWLASTKQSNKWTNVLSVLAATSDQQDLVLAQGCHVSWYQLWRILGEIKFADITMCSVLIICQLSSIIHLLWDSDPYSLPSLSYWVVMSSVKSVNLFFLFLFFLFSAVHLSVIHNKDLLATIHLLVAMVRCFQPELDLPSNVKVEVVAVEVSLGFSRLQICLEHTLQSCCSIFFFVGFNFHPGQQERDQIRCTDRGPNGG